MGKVSTVGVIGGGASGLSAGGLLSRQGVRVKLFEANDKLGGCCANTLDLLIVGIEQAKDCFSEAIQAFEQCGVETYLKQAKDALATLG